MKIRVGWYILYDDGSRVSSEDTEWDDAPFDGVLFVMEQFDDGSETVHMSKDYYLMLEDGTIVSIPGGHLERHLRKLLPQLKYGRWSGNTVFEKAHEDAFGVKP